MQPNIYIDGQQGTTGLELQAKLAVREDVNVLDVDETRRKEVGYKRERYAEADVVVLCLPDDGAREAVELSGSTRILDASTAHRVADDWVYGLPELDVSVRAAISEAQYVSNPGCYPTGFLLAIKPLIECGILSKATNLQVHAVSGYSGGGKKLISKYKDDLVSLMDTRFYSIGLAHKHLSEMKVHAGLAEEPFFLPSVGPFYRGMLVKFVLEHVRSKDVVAAWQARYEDELFVRILPHGGSDVLDEGFLSPSLCNGTNRVDLLAVEQGSQTLVCAILDNLGKGAAGGALQNLNLMLDIEESQGLALYA